MPIKPKRRMQILLDAIRDNDSAARIVATHRMSLVQLHDVQDIPSDYPLTGIVTLLRRHVDTGKGAAVVCSRTHSGLGVNKNITARPGLLISTGERTSQTGFAYVMTVATMDDKEKKFGVGFTINLEFSDGSIGYRAARTPENVSILGTLAGPAADDAATEIALLRLKDYAYAHALLVLRSMCAAMNGPADTKEETDDADEH